MTSEPTIRRARAEDGDDVSRLFAEVDALHHENLPWLVGPPSPESRAEELLTETLAHEDVAVFVADASHGDMTNARLVGAALGRLRKAPEHPGFVPEKWGVLESLAVRADFRRRGVGTLLTRAVETWALERGAPWLEVNVYDFNAEARRFYESLGFLPLRTVLRKPRQGAL
jgi:GNAT superfamily N-acetyltransferase